MSTNALLEVNRLTMRFGGITAIDELSFSAQANSITALIGPNGAGKTTVFNCLTGFYQPSDGECWVQGRDGRYGVHKMVGHRIASEARVARTFQNIRLFPNMTLLENLLVAQHQNLMRASGYSIYGLLGLKRFKQAEHAAIKKAQHWLDRTQLTHLADTEAANLPYGAQRRAEIARAMCIDPVLLCLDEPAAGLNPRESTELNKLLCSIRDDESIGLLLIEHDMSVVMEISDYIYVLDHGQGIAHGTPQQVRNNPDVIQAYLGEPPVSSNDA